MAKNLLANKKKGKKRRASSSSDRERSPTPDEAGLEDQLALQLGIKARAKKLKACCRYDDLSTVPCLNGHVKQHCCGVWCLCQLCIG